MREGPDFSGQHEKRVNTRHQSHPLCFASDSREKEEIVNSNSGTGTGSGGTAGGGSGGGHSPLCEDTGPESCMSPD
jgi:hypothetical protein